MKKTLKSVAIVATLVLALITLTGCMNINFDVKLDKNGAGDVSYTIGYQKSAIESMGMSIEDIKNQDTTLEERQQAGEKEGYKVEEYEDDAIYGIKASKHFDNISEFSMNKELELSQEEVDDKIKFENGVYSQNAKIDLSNMMGDLSGEDADPSETAMMNSVLSQMKMTYKVTLPFKAGNNNATTVSKDGKTLEWDLQVGKVNEVQFEAANSGNNSLLFIILGVVALVVVAVIVVLIAKKGNNVSSEAEAPMAEEPVVEENPIKEEPAEGNNEE